MLDDNAIAADTGERDIFVCHSLDAASGARDGYSKTLVMGLSGDVNGQYVLLIRTPF